MDIFEILNNINICLDFERSNGPFDCLVKDFRKHIAQMSDFACIHVDEVLKQNMYMYFLAYLSFCL